jgi:hypothetical protein
VGGYGGLRMTRNTRNVNRILVEKHFAKRSVGRRQEGKNVRWIELVEYRVQ